MERTITVKGIGKVSACSDYVILKMRLEAKDKQYDKVMDTATKQLAELKQSLLSIGFEKNAVKTTNFKVYTDYDSYKDEHDHYQRVFTGFVCCHQLKLAFDFDLKRLSQVLVTIASCPTHLELDIVFTVKNPTEINDALLREAAINAKKKAELLCEASGVKLGQLLIIDYNWDELNVYSDTKYKFDERSFRELSAIPSMDIEPDNIDVQDTATFVWKIV